MLLKRIVPQLMTFWNADVFWSQLRQ